MILFPFFKNIEGEQSLIIGGGRHAPAKDRTLTDTEFEHICEDAGTYWEGA